MFVIQKCWLGQVPAVQSETVPLPQVSRSPLGRNWMACILRALAVLTGVAYLSCATRCEVTHSGFVIDLCSPQLTFVTGEVFYLEATIRNLTDDTLTILDPTSGQCLKKTILDSNGDYVPSGTIEDYFGGPPTIVLEPRAERFIVVDFRWFGNADRWLGPSRAFKPGSYRVWVQLDSIKSNEIQLVVQDVPESEHGPFTALLSIDSIADHQRALIRANDCISAFPNSVYAPTFHYLVFFHATYLGEHKQVMATARRVIEQFPRSGCIDYAVNYYQKGFIAALGATQEKIATPTDLTRAAMELRAFSAMQPNNRVLSYWIEFYIERYRGWWEREGKYRPTRSDK